MVNPINNSNDYLSASYMESSELSLLRTVFDQNGFKELEGSDPNHSPSSDESSTTSSTSMTISTTSSMEESARAISSSSSAEEASDKRHKRSAQELETNNANSASNKEERRQRNSISQKKYREILKRHNTTLTSHQNKLISIGDQIADGVKRHRMEGHLDFPQFEVEQPLSPREKQDRAADYYGDRIPQAVEKLMNLCEEKTEDATFAKLNLQVTFQAFDNYKQSVEKEQSVANAKIQEMQKRNEQLERECKEKTDAANFAELNLQVTFQAFDNYQRSVEKEKSVANPKFQEMQKEIKQLERECKEKRDAANLAEVKLEANIQAFENYQQSVEKEQNVANTKIQEMQKRNEQLEFQNKIMKELFDEQCQQIAEVVETRQNDKKEFDMALNKAEVQFAYEKNALMQRIKELENALKNSQKK